MLLRTPISKVQSHAFGRVVRAVSFSIAAVSTTTLFSSGTFVITTFAIRNLSSLTSRRTDSMTNIRRNVSWSSSFDKGLDCKDQNSTNDLPASDSSSKSDSQKIREALAGEFPELETLYSDAYLESVAGVSGRSLSYAINHTIRRSLEWRRSYGVETLREAFEVVVNGEETLRHNGDREKPSGEKSGTVVRGRYLVPCNDSKTTNSSVFDINDANESSIPGFVPTPELVQVCSSGAFMVLDEELICTASGGDNKHNGISRWLVVYANTSRLNWWKTGITAGLQYHILVLEDALERIRNNRRYGNRHEKGPKIKTTNDMYLEESVVICVDTTAPPLLPPPLGVLKGMTQLMQQAYPDRIHKIFVGPISPWLQALYEQIRRFLKPRLRDKIVLLGEVPSFEFLARLQSN